MPEPTATTPGTAPRKPVVTALATITIACPDPAELEELFGSALGWQRTARGQVDARLEALWGIRAGSAGGAYSIWQSGDVTRGRVRLLHGSERSRVRPLTPRWAGIEMIVSHDLDGLYERLAAIPWLTTLQAPVTMDWSEFGSNQHRACIFRGPGGTHLSFTMGLTRPVGREFPATRAWAGHVFELPLVTADFAAARFMTKPAPQRERRGDIFGQHVAKIGIASVAGAARKRQDRERGALGLARRDSRLRRRWPAGALCTAIDQTANVVQKCLPSRIARIAVPVRQFGGLSQLEHDRAFAGLDHRGHQGLEAVGQRCLGADPA